jgi:nucleotide-binding universal stress UspA family protein
MATETPASKKPFQVVVGYDMSELTERVVEEALELVSHRLPAELHVITVAQRAGDLVSLPGESRDMTEEAAREAVRLRVAKVVEEAQRRRGPVGLERIAVYVVATTPPREPGRIITDLAKAVDAHLIVVGTHARTGVDRLVMGSVAAQVVRHATTSVYVVQPADFVHGEKVPAIQPPLAPGEHPLKPFEHRRTYHYVDKVSAWTSRTMPAS